MGGLTYSVDSASGSKSWDLLADNPHVNGTLTANLNLSYFGVTQDTINLPNGHINYLGGTFNFGGTAGGTSAAGGRQAMALNLVQCGPVGDKAAGAASPFFCTHFANAQSSYNIGGTDTTTVAGSFGYLFAWNPQVQLLSGATNWREGSIAEYNIKFQAGASANRKMGIKIVKFGDDAVQAGDLTQDAALSVCDQTGASVGWRQILTVGNNQAQWPLDPAGTILGAYAGVNAGAKPALAAYGVDWSAVTFSGAFLKSKGFLVDGSGNLQAARAGFNGAAPIAKPTVTGSKGGNAALASLITALAAYGLIIDGTS